MICGMTAKENNEMKAELHCCCLAAACIKNQHEENIKIKSV